MILPIRERSGSVNSNDPLVQLLYVLLRDHIHPGDLEKIMREHLTGDSVEFSNGWLAQYAQDLAQRIRGYHE